MTQYFEIHPVNPQKRLIQSAASVVRDGGVVVYPTDSCYALGCHIGDKTALERIQKIRTLDKKHNLTLLCSDLSEIGTYAKVHNASFRLMKAITPGPYTFLLMATQDVPKRLQHPKRKTIGILVPAHPVARALVEALGEPFLTVTAMTEADQNLSEALDVREAFDRHIDLVLDGGPTGIEPTTVVDLTTEPPEILRQGKGSAEEIGLA